MRRTGGLGLGPSFQVTTAGSCQESRPFHLLHGPLGLLSRTQARILENPLQGSPGRARQAGGQQGRCRVLPQDGALGVPGLCPPLLLCRPEVPGRWLHARDSLCPSGSAGGSWYTCSSPTAGPPERAWGPKARRGLSGLVRGLQCGGPCLGSGSRSRAGLWFPKGPSMLRPGTKPARSPTPAQSGGQGGRAPGGCPSPSLCP